MSYTLAAISGFLWTLCFPENNFFWLAWIALGVVVYFAMLYVLGIRKRHFASAVSSTSADH